MEQLLENTVRGLGQGSLYTLLGLGFVIRPAHPSGPERETPTEEEDNYDELEAWT